MTFGCRPGTDCNSLQAPGDYTVTRPLHAWTSVDIHLVVTPLPAPGSLVQQGRVLTGSALTHERILLGGVWGEWAAIGSALAPATAAPIITSIDPASLEEDTEDDIVVSGHNFHAGAVVLVENSAELGGATTFISNSSLSRALDASAEGLTGLGNLDIQVINPDGRRSNCIELEITAAE